MKKFTVSFILLSIFFIFVFGTAIYDSDNFVLVNSGSFQMGNPGYLIPGDENEKPAHSISLNYDFLIGIYEVTFKEYDEYCDETGALKPYDLKYGRNKKPVINVSWIDAILYCNWLSMKENLPLAYNGEGNLLDSYGNITDNITKVVGYRLPTEAEWEFAARGGNKSEGYNYSGSNNVDAVAWYSSNSDFKTHDVGQKNPNELGIYDMSGNVWEWCNDFYDSDYYTFSIELNPIGPKTGRFHSVRGGSIYFDDKNCCITNREFQKTDGFHSNLGFRVAKSMVF